MEWNETCRISPPALAACSFAATRRLLDLQLQSSVHSFPVAPTEAHLNALLGNTKGDTNGDTSPQLLLDSCQLAASQLTVFESDDCPLERAPKRTQSQHQIPLPKMMTSLTEHELLKYDFCMAVFAALPPLHCTLFIWFPFFGSAIAVNSRHNYIVTIINGLRDARVLSAHVLGGRRGLGGRHIDQCVTLSFPLLTLALLE